ncbi:hypothetical protein PV646_41240 [Streptomyces sp. ID05-26A]|nr:hypothetical protein [Streptomyces sp. ID05-26A]
MSPLEIGAALHEQVSASLLTVTPEPQRLQFHDLIRLFARECLAQDQKADQMRKALYVHVLGVGIAAGQWFFPTVNPTPADSPFVSQHEAAAWLDRETTTEMTGLTVPPRR